MTDDIQCGANAYAVRQAGVYGGLARKFFGRWEPAITALGLEVNWPAALMVEHRSEPEVPPVPSVATEEARVTSSSQTPNHPQATPLAVNDADVSAEGRASNASAGRTDDQGTC